MKGVKNIMAKNECNSICDEVFTRTERGVDLEVNKLTVGCISSTNHNFNLDQEGNLTVRTITATDQEISTGGSSEIDFKYIR